MKIVFKKPNKKKKKRKTLKIIFPPSIRGSTNATAHEKEDRKDPIKGLVGFSTATWERTL